MRSPGRSPTRGSATPRAAPRPRQPARRPPRLARRPPRVTCLPANRGQLPVRAYLHAYWAAVAAGPVAATGPVDADVPVTAAPEDPRLILIFARPLARRSTAPGRAGCASWAAARGPGGQ